MTDNTQQDIFASGQKTEPKTSATQEGTSLEDKLKEILNENGEPKYKDVTTALDALKASQQHIKRLEEEKRLQDRIVQETQEELARRKSVEDFAKMLQEKNANTPQQLETPTKTEDTSKEKIEDIISRELEKREVQRKRQANIEMVQQSLIKTHGDKAAEFLKTRAVELDTTVEALKEIASTNPKLATELLGVKTVSNLPSSSTTSVPRNTTPTLEKPKWDRGAARGGFTDRELAERFKESRSYTLKRLGINE